MKPWCVPLQSEPEALAYVAANMREWDRREIFATRESDDLESFGAACFAAGEMSWIVGREHPIAAFGCQPLWPGVWSMWLFATDEFNKVGLSVTRFVRRGIIPGLFADGAHRLECRSMDGHDDAHRWLGTLGAEREGTLLDYGRGRETFHVYVWRRG